MPTALFILAAALWLAWAAQAVLSALMVRRFARRFHREPRAAYSRYHPPAAVIVPVKGLDVNLRANLRGLCEQDYPDYRLVLVVEAEDDPAYPVIREELARCTRPAEVVIAGLAAPTQGQKVHNLIAALGRLERRGGVETVWAFADSDAVPGPHWLASLVGPLASPATGVTTGYRWFVPDDAGAPAGGSLGTRLASVINSSVACWAGRDRYNHAWGGSMALRVETARRGGLLDHWRGALSDDYQVSRMVRGLGLRIYFVPRCLVASPAAFDFAGLWGFARRQYVITRTHAPRLFAGGLAVLSLYVLGLLATWAGLVWLLLTQPGRGAWLLPAAAIVVALIANRVRATYRARAVRAAFGADTARRLAPALRMDRWGTPLWMTLHWLIVLSAVAGRTITWRGNRYRIRGPQQIEALNARDKSRR